MTTRSERIEAAALDLVSVGLGAPRDEQARWNDAEMALRAALALPADPVPSIDEREREIMLETARVVLMTKTAHGIDDKAVGVIATVNATHPRDTSAAERAAYARGLSDAAKVCDEAAEAKLREEGPERREPSSWGGAYVVNRDASGAYEDAAARIRALAPTPAAPTAAESCSVCGEESCTSGDCASFADNYMSEETDHDKLNAEQWKELQRILASPKKAPLWLRKALHEKTKSPGHAAPTAVSDIGGDGYTDHQRWLRAVAGLIVWNEQQDEGDATEESIVARYATDPVGGSMDAHTAAHAAVLRIGALERGLRETKEMIDVMNQARVSGPETAS